MCEAAHSVVRRRGPRRASKPRLLGYKSCVTNHLAKGMISLRPSGRAHDVFEYSNTTVNCYNRKEKVVTPESAEALSTCTTRPGLAHH